MRKSEKKQDRGDRGDHSSPSHALMRLLDLVSHISSSCGMFLESGRHFHSTSTPPTFAFTRTTAYDNHHGYRKGEHHLNEKEKPLLIASTLIRTNPPSHAPQCSQRDETSSKRKWRSSPSNSGTQDRQLSSPTRIGRG
jgi:hypothetical protein